MKKYKLVATDLDNTLIVNFNEIPEENIGALQYLKEKGIPVVLSTGRNINLIENRLLNNDSIKYIISCNGANVYQTKPVALIYKNEINHEVLKDLLLSIKDLAESIQLLYNDHLVSTDDLMVRMIIKTCINESIDINDLSNKNIKDYITLSDDLVDYIKRHEETVAKVDIITKDGFEDQFVKVMSRFKNLTYVKCFKNNYEITNLNVNKGQTLSYLINRLRIDKNETLAFGDSGNDLSMAEIGIEFCAMGNASNEVKAVSNFVALDAQDCGFAKMIKKLIK